MAAVVVVGAVTAVGMAARRPTARSPASARATAGASRSTLRTTCGAGMRVPMITAVTAVRTVGVRARRR